MSDASVQRALREAHAFHQRGDLFEAERRYVQVIAGSPRDPDALGLLGALYLQRGDHDRAAQFLQTAVLYRPTFANAHFNLAQVHQIRGEFAKAENHIRLALRQQPRAAGWHRALAGVCYRQKRYVEAISALENAAAIEPGHLAHYVDLAKMYREVDDFEGMFRTADRGLVKDPAAADLHIARAEVFFEQGNLTEAWRELEWRFEASQNPVPRKTFAFPRWQGEPLAGKSLLVWREQGVGDEIMYASMFGELVAAGARCVIECNERLTPLFARAFPGAEFVAENTRPAGPETFDYHIAIGDLGLWLRPALGAFPQREGYLSADPERVAALRARYAAGSDRPFLIGIAWKSTGVEFAAEKSANLALWGPIFGLPGVRFVNAQYGDCRAALAGAREGFGADIVEDAEVDPLKDIDAAAAQIAALDLVITTSNTAAHLAGALGVPTLCMLPRTLGGGRRWYWFARRPVCPWYPRVARLIQSRDGDWTDVIAEAALAALDIATAKGAVAKPLKYLLGLARGYVSAGLHALADRVLERADVAAPGKVQVLLECARVKKLIGRYEEALALFDRALKEAPRSVELLNARGMTLMDLRRPEEAERAYRSALEHGPDVAVLHNNLGTALRTLGRAPEALAAYETAQRLDPEFAAILYNLGGLHNERGSIAKAFEYYDRLLAADPEHVEAHYDKAQALLRGGRLAEGWREFAWRMRRPQANRRHEHFPAPVWTTQPLEGSKVLVWTEQGLGDEIMTASLVPDLLARAARVTFLCTRRLTSLMRRSLPKAVVDVLDMPLPATATAPDIDFQMSLAELGLALRPSLNDFPRRRRFLQADANLTAKLRAKYAKVSPGNKLVGIAWKSPLNDEIGNLKASALTDWLPILKLSGITFVSLQYGETAADLRALEVGYGMRVYADPDIDPMGDMDAPAAQIAAMDLVISVSNTTVHLAGGLGIPTFVLLPAHRGRLWYWFLDRTDSPWYPSLRLFTATDSLRWDDAVARVADETRAFLALGVDVAPGTA